MQVHQPLTETVILNLKNGVNLDGGSDSLAERTFGQLTNTVRTQQGFRCQLWGHQVENPNVFVWSIDWESFENCTAFLNSEEYGSFRAVFTQVFDLEVSAPLTIYTQWTSKASAALKAPVTEVAFFTLPNGAGEEAKNTIEDALKPILQAVKTVGKASESAIGWASKVVPHAAVTPKPNGEWLHGVIGYASIDDHMRWRDQPEHEKAGEIFDELGRRNLSLHPANVQGIDPSTGYFQVKFREEV